MNPPEMVSRGLQPIVGAPVWVVLLLKMTAILVAAWLAHLALSRTNPRWRILLWRGAALGLIGLPVLAWLSPGLEIRVEPPRPGGEPSAAQAPLALAPADPSPAARAGLPGILGGPDVPIAPDEPSLGASGRDAIASFLLPQGEELTSASTASPGLPWRGLLLALWLGGIAVLAFRLGIGHYRVRQMLRRSRPALPWVQNECLRVAEAIGCRGRVEAIQSTDVQAPLLCGLRRPRLFLPARICEPSYREDLPGIFAHELSHVRFHDLPWNAGLHLLSILCWFHPLVWGLRKAHLTACELVCDAASASFVGDTGVYCRTLARVAVEAAASLPVAGIAMARVSDVSRRLNALRKKVFDLPLRRRSVIGFGLAGLLGMLFIGVLRFAFTELPPAEPVAWAGQAEGRPADTVASPGEEPATARKEGIPLEGTVTDPEGQPVAEALVAEGRDRFGSQHPTTRTDKQGHFRFASLAPGNTVLTVVSPGLSPAVGNFDVQPGVKPVDLLLEKGTVLRVRVVDREGKPLEGVYIAPDTWRGYRTLIDVGISGQTDPQGRWTWTWAPKDPVEMSILKRGYMDVRKLPLAARENEHVVTLHGPLTISGRVLDAETKQPIQSFRVIDGRVSAGTREGVGWNRRGAAEGKNGLYSLVITYPHPAHLVRIEAEGYRPAISRSFKSDEGEVTFDFTLSKGQAMSVLVRLPDGKPAAGAAVRIAGPKDGATSVTNGKLTSGQDFMLNLTAGPDGRFRIEPQDEGFQLAVVHDQGYGWSTSEQLAASPQMTLKPWSRIEGVVRRGTKPWPGHGFALKENNPPGTPRTFVHFSEQVQSDAEGRFVFSKVKAGHWRLQGAPVIRQDMRFEIAPGQTIKLSLGGMGRPVIGRFQWPEGKPPEADLSRIGAQMYPKLPVVLPPKEVRDQGPDAYRAWMKQWQDSEEGKARRKEAERRSDDLRIVLMDRDGSFRIENVVPGPYYLSVYVAGRREGLRSARPPGVSYGAEFSVGEIPGGVSDEPLDLGRMALKAQTEPESSPAPAKPSAPQATGEKSVGGIRDHLDLLRRIVATCKENKEKVQTWQGRATVEDEAIYDKGASGSKDSHSARFVFDRARKSVRWNTTLERWSKIQAGREEPQPVPQIVNGMRTPEAFYRFSEFGSWPVNPANRPLTMIIYAPAQERIQPQLYDFDPMVYFDPPHGDLAQDLSFYVQQADNPGMGNVKVKRDGDLVVIDVGPTEGFYRHTISLSQGCNPVAHDALQTENTWQYRWTYEKRDGIWLPKTWTEMVRQKDRRNADRKVTFVESLVNQKVEPAAFSISSLGLQRGDEVEDRRTQQQYKYTGE